MSKDTVESNASVFSRETIIRSVITIAVLVALYLLVRRLSGVLLPFLISFVVAYMLAPIVNFFQHKCRLKNRVLSIVVTLLLVIGLLTGAVAAVVPAISRQATSLSQSVKTYVSQWDGNEYFSPEVNERIEEIIQSIDIKTLINSEEVQQGIKKVIPILGDWISSGVNALMGLAVAFICILYIIFLLIDYEKISTNWHKYIPNRFRDSIVMLMGDLDRNMNAYFRGQALVAGIVGILFAIGFQIIGLPMGMGYLCTVEYHILPSGYALAHKYLPMICSSSLLFQILELLIYNFLRSGISTRHLSFLCTLQHRFPHLLLLQNICDQNVLRVVHRKNTVGLLTYRNQMCAFCGPLLNMYTKIYLYIAIYSPCASISSSTMLTISSMLSSAAVCGSNIAAW